MFSRNILIHFIIIIIINDAITRQYGWFLCSCVTYPVRYMRGVVVNGGRNGHRVEIPDKGIPRRAEVVVDNPVRPPPRVVIVNDDDVPGSPPPARIPRVPPKRRALCSHSCPPSAHCVCATFFRFFVRALVVAWLLAFSPTIDIAARRHHLLVPRQSACLRFQLYTQHFCTRFFLRFARRHGREPNQPPNRAESIGVWCRTRAERNGCCATNGCTMRSFIFVGKLLASILVRVLLCVTRRRGLNASAEYGSLDRRRRVVSTS